MLIADWREADLGDVATLQRGYDLPYSSRKPGSIPVVTSSGVTDTHAEARERGPGVVTGRYGTIGKVFFVNEDYWPHNTTLFVKDFHGNDPLFIAYLLCTIDFKTHSGKSGVPGVNRNDLHSLAVRVPSTIDEQRAIAGVLGDVDALIGALDRLIAKKRDLKQAAMQQLLTGQIRLPGFSGEWVVKRLCDVAEIVMGQSPSSSNYNTRGEGLPLIQGNADVSNRKTIKRIFTTEITKRGKCGDILMSVRAPVGEISRAVFDVCLGRGVCAIRYDNDYMYHYLVYHESNWAKLSKGSTFDAVNSADVKAFEVHLPTNTNEQIAIAVVLSDMDAEIAGLEQRLAKTRALKQGMMQELLTGRTRLI